MCLLHVDLTRVRVAAHLALWAASAAPVVSSSFLFWIHQVPFSSVDSALPTDLVNLRTLEDSISCRARVFSDKQPPIAGTRTSYWLAGGLGWLRHGSGASPRQCTWVEIVSEHYVNSRANWSGHASEWGGLAGRPFLFSSGSHVCMLAGGRGNSILLLYGTVSLHTRAVLCLHNHHNYIVWGRENCTVQTCILRRRLDRVFHTSVLPPIDAHPVHGAQGLWVVLRTLRQTGWSTVCWRSFFLLAGRRCLSGIRILSYKRWPWNSSVSHPSLSSWCPHFCQTLSSLSPQLPLCSDAWHSQFPGTFPSPFSKLR